MKTISLWQPWASLIAAGAKPFETRSWSPPKALIGQRIAIHAAVRKPNMAEIGHLLSDVRAGILQQRAADLAEPVLVDAMADGLPLGAVLCTARLVAGYRCGQPHGVFDVEVDIAISAGDDPVLIESDPFGDFSPGRWAWLLADIEPLDPIQYVRGHQGLWNWTPDTTASSITPTRAKIPATLTENAA